MTTQPPACGKISDERLRFHFKYTAIFTANPNSIYQTYMYTEQDVAELHAICDELLSHRHPAPVADERAEVAPTMPDMSGGNPNKCRFCGWFAGAHKRGCISAQPSGALEREKNDFDNLTARRFNWDEVVQWAMLHGRTEKFVHLSDYLAVLRAPPQSSIPSADATSSVAIATLRAALEKYGQHAGDCLCRLAMDPRPHAPNHPCNCGFAAALAAHPPAKGDGLQAALPTPEQGRQSGPSSLSTWRTDAAGMVMTSDTKEHGEPVTSP